MHWNRRQVIQSIGAIGLASSVMIPVRASAAEPFRIGALNDVTGAGSPYGSSMQKAILFSAQDVNAAGGAAGRILQVFAEDSQTSPEAGVLAAKKLVEVNKVQAVLGTWASAVTLAVAPILDSAGIIHMTNAGTSELRAANKKGLIFRFSSMSERTGSSLAQGAIAEGYKRIAIMGINNGSGREVAEGAKKTLQAAGREVVGEVIYEPNQPSYRSEIQRALAGRPDVLIIGGFLPDVTIIVRETIQSGANVKFMAPAWAVTPKLIEAIGTAADGIMSADYVSAIDTPAYNLFVKRFKEAVGSDPSGNYYASCAYDMVQSLALAIQAAGPTADNVAIAKALREVSNPPGKVVWSFAEGKKLLMAGEKINYEGASGPLDFDEKGDVKAIFKLSVVKNGAVRQLRILK